LPSRSRCVADIEQEIPDARVDASIERGPLEGDQVATIIASAIAARAAEAGRVRRADWRQRKRSAGRLLKGLVKATSAVKI
jgi:hypothetical protein